MGWGCPHYSGSSLLISTSLQIPPQTHSYIHFLGESNFSQVDIKDERSYMGVCHEGTVNSM